MPRFIDPEPLMKQNIFYELYQDREGRRKIPKFKDFPVTFRKAYGIKTSTERRKIYSQEVPDFGQEYSNTCGIASSQICLYELADISFPDENPQISLMQDLYAYEKYIREEKMAADTNIKKDGAYQIHLTYLASFFDLKLFSSCKGSIDMLTRLNNLGIPVILHKPFRNEKGIIDGTHYLVEYGYSKPEKKIFTFDPSYRGKRPRENIKHNGTYRSHHYEDFLDDWSFENGQRQLLFFCNPDEKPQGKWLKGYYTN